VQSLVHKSLVRRVNEDRFDLLVSVQEYAGEHLRTPGRYEGSGPASLRAAEIRHGAWFAGLGQTTVTAGGGPEIDNLVVACRRAVARGDGNTATATLESAWAVLRLRGPFKVGFDLASLVRAIPGLEPGELARADLIAARALDTMGKDVESYAEFQAALARARKVGDRRCECVALIGLSFRHTHVDSVDVARARGERALVLARELSDPILLSDAHNHMGNFELMSGRTGEARAHYEVGLALARKAGDRHQECSVLGNLSNVCAKVGEMDASRSYGEAALAVAREVGNRRLEANMLCNLGLLDQLQQRLDEALDHHEAALAVARELGHARLESIVLCNLGIYYDGLARFEDARRHYDAALLVARELADRRAEGQVLGYLGLLHARQQRFDEARHCLDLSAALLRAASDPESLGIMLCSRAESERLAGRSEAAAAALVEAAAIAVEIEAGEDSELGLALARVRNLVEQDAGSDT
jgi:tetratricopeptide (TPR) repeat protein